MSVLLQETYIHFHSKLVAVAIASAAAEDERSKYMNQFTLTCHVLLHAMQTRMHLFVCLLHAFVLYDAHNTHSQNNLAL